MEINGVEMVTDRTLSDVEIAKSLIRRGFENLEAKEKEEFLSGLKGAYNYIDFNRVESAVEYISKKLYNTPDEIVSYAEMLKVAWENVFKFDSEYDKAKYFDVVVKKDWNVGDVLTESDRDRYINNILLIVSSIFNTDDLPKTMNGLTHSKANKIEISLIDVNNYLSNLKKNKEMLIKNTSKSWFYSADIFGGEI